MKKSSWVVLGIVMALVGLLIYMKIASQPRLSEQDQISQLLTDAQSAIGRRDIWGAMRCVAGDYKDPSGNNHDTLEALTIQAFRSRGKWIVTLENTNIQVQDRTATVQLDVSVTTFDRSTGSMREIYASPMTLELRKEPAKRWLVFPTEKWRITSITNLPSGGMD